MLRMLKTRLIGFFFVAESDEISNLRLIEDNLKFWNSSRIKSQTRAVIVGYSHLIMTFLQ